MSSAANIVVLTQAGRRFVAQRSLFNGRDVAIEASYATASRPDAAAVGWWLHRYADELPDALATICDEVTYL